MTDNNTSKGSSKTLTRELVEATLPMQLSLIGVVSIFVFSVAAFFSYQQTISQHQQRAQQFHTHITTQIEALHQQLVNVASNDFVVNSIVDLEQRDAYLPLFFQFLRINNSTNSNIAFIDFNGDVITQRGLSKARLLPYANVIQTEVLERANDVILIDAKGVFISVPVTLDGLAEGAVNFYVSTLTEAISPFKSDIDIDVYPVTNLDVSSQSHVPMTQSIHPYNSIVTTDTDRFSQINIIGDWQFATYQSYQAAFIDLIALSFIAMVVLILTFLGTFVGARAAAKHSALILQNFKTHLDNAIDKDKTDKATASSDIIELVSIQDSFLSLFEQLKYVSISSEQVNTIFNGMHEYVVLIDEKNTPILANAPYQAFCASANISDSEVSELIEQFRLVEELDEDLPMSENPAIEKQYKLDSERKSTWVRWYKSSINSKQYANGSILVGTDITEQRTLQSELVIKNKAFDKANASILISDVSLPHGPIVYVNQAFYQLTGYPEDKVIGHNCKFMQGIDTEPEKVEEIRQAITNRRSITTTLLNYRSNGEAFYNRLILSPVRNEIGDVQYYIGIQQDVTREKNTADLLLKAKQKAEEASLLKNNFLATVSHEIRTPINGIAGTIQLLNDTPLDSAQKRYIDLASQSTNKLLSIVEDILDFANIEVGALNLENREFDLEKLLTLCIRDYKQKAVEKNLLLECEISLDGMHSVIGDALRVRQIFNNLLNNALKFTEQGYIKLTAQWDSEPSDVPFVKISVEDTGIGIAKEQHTRVFEQFLQEDNSVTRQFGGTGLGLSICKQLCQLMGGAIQLKSQKGHGATFTVYLPLSPVIKTVKSARMLSLPTQSQPQQLTLLIVEDNALNLEIVCAQLAQYKLLTATHGEIALQILNDAKNAIDLVVMDCQMPVMDGYSCTRAIRNGIGGVAYKKIPIIALTANAMKGDKEKCLEAGMNDYLAKPCTASALLECVDRWLVKANTPNNIE